MTCISLLALEQKISEVAHNVQERVKYTLEKTLGITVESVNIYVQGVRVIKES